MEDNETYMVAAVPHGLPDIKSTWHLAKARKPTEKDLHDGEFLAKSKYISVDPYLRHRLEKAQPNEPMVSGNVSEVVASKSPEYKVGDTIFAYLPWAKYNIIHPSKADHLRKVDPHLAPVTTALGVLGMPGMTAYVGLIYVGELKNGETVVVSGAAGAVGSLAGQIAKLRGCRVVGTVGSQEKADHILNTLGFDAAINYREHDNIEKMRKALSEACPNGIDVYFDNTGGHVTDAVFDLTNKFARVVICGQISMYNATEPPVGPQFLMKLIYKSVSVKGFLVYEFDDKTEEFLTEVGKWVSEGKIKYNETITEGFHQLPETFLALFAGHNVGKSVVKID